MELVPCFTVPMADFSFTIMISNKQSTIKMVSTQIESQTDQIESTRLSISSIPHSHLRNQNPHNQPHPANRLFLPPTSHTSIIPTSVSSDTVVAAKLHTSSSGQSRIIPISTLIFISSQILIFYTAPSSHSLPAPRWPTRPDSS